MSDDSMGALGSLPRPLPDAVVRYAPHEDGLVDLHLPHHVGGSPPPLVVLVHGGFWRQAYDRTHTRPTAAALASAGCVVATPEYRRVGGTGGWPRSALDVEDAVRALPDLLASLDVSTEGLTVVGHSAGGHLALWLVNQLVPVRRAVALAPVADLRAAARAGLGDRATQELLGGEPEEVPDRYDEADPAVRLQQRPGCEVVVVHGGEDEVVPLSISHGLVQRHPFVDLRVVDNADHFDVMTPGSDAWPVVLGAVRGERDG
jgi:acetyl esterase/lipase